VPLGRVSRIAAGAVGSGAQPDEDVGDGNRGLVADGELVEAGRHRPELLAPVHQPLDGLIASDKFCWTRYGQLRLVWWRRPLRLRLDRGV
jgi:hypothetical protein